MGVSQKVPSPLAGEGQGEGANRRVTPIPTFPHQGGRSSSNQQIRRSLLGADACFLDQLAETRDIGFDQRGEFLAGAADEIQA